MAEEGHPQFHALLDQMKATHIAKSAGYAGAENPDPFANFRGSENVGVPAFLGAWIRKGDKHSREASLIRNPDNDRIGESLTDTLIDDASYCLITLILFNEHRERNMRFLELLRDLNTQLDSEFPE